MLRRLQGQLRNGVFWGVGLALLEISLLRLLAPSIQVVTPLLGWATLLCLGLCFVPFWRWLPLGAKSYQLSEEGLRSGRNLQIRWRDAVGWFPAPDDQDGFVIIGKGGLRVQLRFPTEPTRTDLVTALSRRLPVMVAGEAAPYIVDVKIDLQVWALLILVVFVMALLGCGLAPYVTAVTKTASSALLIPALTALVPAYLSWSYLRTHYPQFQRQRLALACIVWWLGTGVGLPLIAVAIARR